MTEKKKRQWPLWAVVGLVLFHIILFAATGKAIFGSSAKVPSSFTETNDLPTIYPDYVGVTVPANIAPLHFHIDHDSEATDFVTRLTAGSESWALSGDDVRPGLKKWHKMVDMALAAEGNINIEVFIKREDRWLRQKPFQITVSTDSIDPYISYRLISPSYVTYEDLTLNQRCLENFDESLIYGNMINSDEENGQCINCHHAQWYNPNRVQFHVRQHLGGTVIAYDGKVQKIDLKTDSTISAGVYPTWHPTKPWIVYSTNNTGQSFHTRDVKKIEVQDTKSNLIFFDLESNTVTPITRDTTDFDCFPFWSPDGKYVYYVSAHWERRDTINMDFELIQNYKEVQYNLYRIPFNEKDQTFGPRELIYDAVARNRSVTLPRVSPDGRWLMFTEGQFGVFHIWHNDADLFLMDLTQAQPVEPTHINTYDRHRLSEYLLPPDANNLQREIIADSLREEQGLRTPLPAHIRNITEINSPDVESYHSWSSNGCWVIFSSRRDDGNFTRPFIAHHDGNGHFSKPFELPQDNPQYHRQFMRSYNIPEFLFGPVTIRPQEFASVIKKDATKAQLKIK
ncbi:MAG: PD40 domain-containing protein [Bacteroidaceae bacterium]|nr:PD40 domain-containing protein [Bacteroidaceae bacterium]